MMLTKALGPLHRLEGGGDGVQLLAVELRPHQRFAFAADAVHGQRDVFHGIGTDDEVEKRHAFEQAVLFLLGQTAGQPEHEVRILLFERAEMAEQGKHLLLGLLADRAGVD